MRERSRLLMLVCLTMLAFNGIAIAADPPFDVADVREVRVWVRLEDRWRKEFRYLMRKAEKVFPAYEAILSDPKSSAPEVDAVFCILFDIEADRRRFIKYALSHLTNDNVGVRHSAVVLLKTIGSPTEASPLVALLSDENKTTVPYAAARALATIGDQNEVVAIDVWLRGVCHRDVIDLRQYVQEYRDKLKKRLVDDKDPKKKAEKLNKCWAELRITKTEDEYKVHRAVRNLTAFGNETVAFLNNRVRPVPVDTQKHLDQLVADLDSDSFERREAATRELSRGIVAEAVLEKALADHPTLEMRRRLEAILEDFPDWRTKNPELLRQFRVVWVLQQIGTPEARTLLEKLAAGAPSAALTQKAKDALQSLDRLKKR